MAQNKSENQRNSIFYIELTDIVSKFQILRAFGPQVAMMSTNIYESLETLLNNQNSKLIPKNEYQDIKRMITEIQNCIKEAKNRHKEDMSQFPMNETFEKKIEQFIHQIAMELDFKPAPQKTPQEKISIAIEGIHYAAKTLADPKQVKKFQTEGVDPYQAANENLNELIKLFDLPLSELYQIYPKAPLLYFNDDLKMELFEYIEEKVPMNPAKQISQINTSKFNDDFNALFTEVKTRIINIEAFLPFLTFVNGKATEFVNNPHMIRIKIDIDIPEAITSTINFFDSTFPDIDIIAMFPSLLTLQNCISDDKKITLNYSDMLTILENIVTIKILQDFKIFSEDSIQKQKKQFHTLLDLSFKSIDLDILSEMERKTIFDNLVALKNPDILIQVSHLDTTKHLQAKGVTQAIDNEGNSSVSANIQDATASIEKVYVEKIATKITESKSTFSLPNFSVQTECNDFMTKMESSNIPKNQLGDIKIALQVHLITNVKTVGPSIGIFGFKSPKKLFETFLETPNTKNMEAFSATLGKNNKEIVRAMELYLVATDKLNESIKMENK